MVQATTPTFILTLQDDVDLTIAENVYFSMQQGCTHLDKAVDKTDIGDDGKTVSIYLTQEETLRFNKGVADIQLNWTYPSSQNGGRVLRACSEIVSVPVSRNLMQEVVE